MNLMFCQLLFLTGLIGKASSVIDWAASISAAAAATSALTPGVSVLQGLAGAPEYSVVCSIVVENWTKYPLVNPTSHINGGILKSSPVTVQPGQKEMFVATGTSGTASWLIQNKNKRAVIMWSCPYSFDLYSNWLGVGLTTTGQNSHKDWFDQMYNGNSGNGLQFQRKDYYYSTATISVKDQEFEITGTMGTSHKAKARIIVRPLKESDLAGPLNVKIVSRNLKTKQIESTNQHSENLNRVKNEHVKRLENEDENMFGINDSDNRRRAKDQGQRRVKKKRTRQNEKLRQIRVKEYI